MKHKVVLFVPVLAALIMAGCGGEPAVKPDVEDRGVGRGAEPSGVGVQPGVEGAALGPGATADLLGKRRVYFSFDSSAVDEENRAIIEAHAAYLANNPQIKVVLEGHADERGTREYNLALGERRAQSVERMVRVLGVTTDRVKTVSYGEEKPVALDHNESAWRLNRRVEIIY